MPATLNEPPERWTSYQHDTASMAMCGSLATMGLPVGVSLPETTQLLLPSPAWGSLAAVPTGWPPERPRG